MKRVIITAFEPFGEYRFNPTEEIVKRIHLSPFDLDTMIFVIILPCEYYAFSVLDKAICEVNPNLVVSLGLSSSVTKLRIESRFKNLMESKYADNKGFKPQSQKILKSRTAPNYVEANSNPQHYKKLLEDNNIPIEISSDADTFICNSLGFLTSYKITKENLNMENIFMHIPWTDSYRDMVKLEEGKIFIDSGTVIEAIKLIIKSSKKP